MWLLDHNPDTASLPRLGNAAAPGGPSFGRPELHDRKLQPPIGTDYDPRTVVLAQAAQACQRTGVPIMDHRSQIVRVHLPVLRAEALGQVLGQLGHVLGGRHVLEPVRRTAPAVPPCGRPPPPATTGSSPPSAVPPGRAPPPAARRRRSRARPPPRRSPRAPRSARNAPATHPRAAAAATSGTRPAPRSPSSAHLHPIRPQARRWTRTSLTIIGYVADCDAHDPKRQEARM